MAPLWLNAALLNKWLLSNNQNFSVANFVIRRI
jgi:hypothetical protein